MQSELQWDFIQAGQGGQGKGWEGFRDTTYHIPQAQPALGVVHSGTAGTQIHLWGMMIFLPCLIY